MKRNHHQPLASLPHVTDLATCEHLLIATETGIEKLIARRDTFTPADYNSYERECNSLLRELRIRHADLIARAAADDAPRAVTDDDYAITGLDF